MLKRILKSIALRIPTLNAIIKEKAYLTEFTGVNNQVLGQPKPMTTIDIINWYKTASELLVDELNILKISQIDKENKLSTINRRDKYTLTIVTSLYKGEKYIKNFLENIVNQSIFDECELFIVDANSPENEYEIIKQYTNIYPNIRYLRLEEKISIYQAWNIAIKESKSEFITNANVDDLHRLDAFELKIQALRQNPETDVVYSDVYYSYLANVPFNIVAKCGLRTNFVTANKFNLLSYNSPHNAPMWRRSLHDKIGFFDSQYKSCGDYEFWLRAAFSGSLFFKLDEVLVVYYFNPQGMSTNQDSPSKQEDIKVHEIYENILKKLDAKV